MAKVVPARMTADVSGEFVVFLIGMRINKAWKVHKWWPVAMAMTPMLRTLRRQPDLGLLGLQTWISPRGPLMVQYWRSMEHLERFATDASLPHHAAWKRFNRQVGASGDVGIWHETYLAGPGRYEAVYANMPAFGLARAGGYRPVATRGERAAQRLAAGDLAAGDLAAGDLAAGDLAAGD